ncbi:MAG: winged helix-turn-helix domain-containing protein [Acutalibacteraceae bacterium]
MLEMGGIQVDDLRREVSVDETPISLTPKEYELLVCLMEHRGMVLSREQLLRRVWGYAYDGDIRTVDTHIKNCVRHSAGGPEIRTVIKTGYRFEPEEPEG